MDELEINPFAEKLNVGLAIQEIGPNKEIKLMFDKKSKFMISSTIIISLHTKDY